MPNWDDTDGQSGKEMKDNTNIEIINHIDTGNGHKAIFGKDVFKFINKRTDQYESEH